MKELSSNEASIWTEYQSNEQSFNRKISFRYNLLTFAMGFLHCPECSEEMTSRDSATLHMGYIQFEEEVGLTDVINLVGIKMMHFSISKDMYEHISGFEKFCLDGSIMFYMIGKPLEPMEVQCGNVEVASDDMSVNQRRSSEASDGAVPSTRNPDEEFVEEEERSDAIDSDYADDSVSSMSTEFDGCNRRKSNAVAPSAIDEVEVVDLTKDSFEENVVRYVDLLRVQYAHVYGAYTT